MTKCFETDSGETREQREKALDFLDDFQNDNMAKYAGLDLYQRIAIYLHLGRVGLLEKITFPEWVDLVNWVTKATKKEDEIESFLNLLGLSRGVFDYLLNAA